VRDGTSRMCAHPIPREARTLGAMGRSHLVVRVGRRRRHIAFLGAVLGTLLAPTFVAAHPLGNFTINTYADVRIEPERVLLDVVVDQAEVPTYTARADFDLDGDGEISDEEIETGRVDACRAGAGSFELTAGGQPLELVNMEAGLSFPPGVSGLSTMRLTCAFEARLAAPIGVAATEITYKDGSYPERVGWREIVVTGSGVTLATGGSEPLRRTSVSARLTSYPEDLLSKPLSDEEAVVEATIGGPTLPPFDVPDAEPVPGAMIEPSPGAPASTAPSPVPVASEPAVVPGGVDAAELPSIFREADLTPIVAVLSLLTAAGLGAWHALTPGHGKTLMAAYLVGTRGTALHALGLGLSVSVSHTVGILVLAGVVVGLAGAVAPDTVVRWAPIVAAISIVLIGGWMLLNELRRRRAAARAATGQAHAAPGHHHESPDHEGADHHHHDRDHIHTHGAGAHSHVPAPGSSITWRSLFLLGLAGGLIPSTSALLILLGSLAAGRPLFGFVLVVAFGLGMAIVMGGLGFALVAARDRVERIELGEGLGRVRESVPLIASVVVLSFGLYLTAQALGGGPTL
jgi:nickel/cobalt transporter (NicO) family protein